MQSGHQLPPKSRRTYLWSALASASPAAISCSALAFSSYGCSTFFVLTAVGCGVTVAGVLLLQPTIRALHMSRQIIVFVILLIIATSFWTSPTPFATDT